MQAIFDSIMKVQKCMNKQCKKEMDALVKLQDGYRAVLAEISKTIKDNKPGFEKKVASLRKKMDAELKKIEASKESLAMSECSAERCQKENTDNFKVLAAFLQKDCKTNKKSCELVKHAKKLSKKKITAKDLMDYKKREMASL